jgi:hypothetical protein
MRCVGNNSQSDLRWMRSTMPTTITVPLPISACRIEKLLSDIAQNVDHTFEFCCLKVDVKIRTHSIHKFRESHKAVLHNRIMLSPVIHQCELAERGQADCRFTLLFQIVQHPVRTAMHTRLHLCGNITTKQNQTPIPNKLYTLFTGYMCITY